MSSFCIVTAADAAMENLAKDLCLSLGNDASSLRVINIGMSDEAVAWFASRGTPVIEYSAPDEGIAFARSYYRALYIRPFLPRIVETEIIMWIDADCWVQDLSAIQSFRQRAEQRPGAFAICSMVDVDYPRCISAYIAYQDTYRAVYAALFGEEDSAFLYGRAIFSGGVFCASRDSEVWPIWAAELKRIYGEVKPADGLGHIAEQSALNRILHKTGLFEVLTSDHNWHCHCSNLERRGEAVVILPSGRVPKIVHLSESGSRRLQYMDARLFYGTAD
jgi:hypothetical protein